MQAARNATCCRHPGERMQAEGAAVVDNEVALVSRTENVHGMIKFRYL